MEPQQERQGGSASVTEIQDDAGNLLGAQVISNAGPVTLNGVPLIPGQSLTSGALRAEVNLGNKNVQLEGHFTPGPGSDGLEPLTEAVTLRVGSFVLTIPAGSFTLKNGKQHFSYRGTIDGVKVKASLKGPQRGGSYKVGVHLKGRFTSITRPTVLTLVVGDDTATIELATRPGER